MNGECDDETPAKWAKAMSDNFENSYHLTFKGQKQTPTTNLENQWATQAAKDFYNISTKTETNYFSQHSLPKSKNMSNQAKQVFESFRTSMLSKTDAWKDLLADNVTLTGPLAAVQGKEKFIEINEPFFASIRGSVLSQLIEKGHTIITQITTDVEVPSGKVITLKVCEWYEIEENKIKSLTVYFDTAEFLKEIQAG